MASGFYPALPDPVITNPLTSAGAGLGLGMEISGQALKQKALGLELEHAQQRAAGMKEVAQTGDVTKMWQYDPETAINMEKQLLSMDETKRKAAMEKMTAGLDISEKALPYFLAMSKTNPQEAARWWPTYIKEMQAAGVNVPPGFETYNPQTLEAAYKTLQDVKTVKERVKAALDLMKEKEKGEWGLARERLRGETVLGAAGIRAGATDRRTQVLRDRPTGKGGMPSYNEFAARPENVGRPVKELAKEYNDLFGTGREKYESPEKKELTKEKTKATKAKTGVEEEKKKAFQALGGGAPAEGYTLPSGGKMVPATKEEYDAWHKARRDAGLE